MKARAYRLSGPAPLFAVHREGAEPLFLHEVALKNIRVGVDQSGEVYAEGILLENAVRSGVLYVDGIPHIGLHTVYRGKNGKAFWLVTPEPMRFVVADYGVLTAEGIKVRFVQS